MPLPSPSLIGTDPNVTPPVGSTIYFDPQYFLDLWQRLLPPSYLAPLKSPGPGYELLQAYAKLFARMSMAAARLEAGGFILTAPSGVSALAQVLITRSASSTGTVVLKAGTVLESSAGRYQYVTISDLTFGPGVYGPLPVLAYSLGQAYVFNLVGQTTLSNGETAPGSIDSIASPVTDPVFVGDIWTVEQVDYAVGSTPPLLDQLGRDRGMPRLPGETDTAYRARIRRLPDTVSPAAIRRAVEGILSAFPSVTYDFIETWQSDYQTAYDVTSSIPNVDTTLFVYDDPRPAYPPFRNRWLAEDYRGAFIIVVPNLGAIADCGMAFDDTAMIPNDLISPDTLGTRAMSAYDVDALVPVPQGGYDGFDLPKQAVYQGLWDLLDQIKAAGVTVGIELRGE